MTTVNGTLAYCGFGQQAAIKLTCVGQHCDGLTDFPDTTCSTSGSTMTCTNDVECEKALWVTNLSYIIPDAADGLVQQNQTTTITECDYEFEVTSNGKPSGVTFRNLTAPKPECEVLVPLETYSNTTVPSSSGNSSASMSSGPPRPSIVPITAAARSLKAPYFFVIFIFLCFFTPALAVAPQARSIIPAKPDESLFPKDPAVPNDICARLGFPKLPILKSRALDNRISEFGAAASLDERQLSELTTWLKTFFWGRVNSYIASKVRNELNNKKLFADCWQAELSSFMCKTAVSQLVINRIAIIRELVPACVSLVNSFVLVDPEPATKLALFVGSGVFCNLLVAEAVPLIPCLTDTICGAGWIEQLFPSTKCEGPIPQQDPVGTVYTYRTSPDYQSGGSLLTNPKKCGTFFNQVGGLVF
jgi:hypothetical protein